MRDILQKYSNAEDILGALQLSREDIAAIADKTKGQRDNSVWFDMRFGRITASNFGPVIAAIDKKR